MKITKFAILAVVLSLFTALPLTAQVPSVVYTSISGATLFVMADATVTETSSVIPISNKSSEGNLMITTTGITGSPSGCTIALYSMSNVSTTAPAAAEQTPSVTITTGTHTQVVAALSASDISTDALKAVYACSTYPTAGYISVTFAPISTIATGALTITTPAQVQNYNSGSLTVTPSDGTNAIGALVNYGSTPTGVKALSTNTFVTNTAAQNLTQIGGATQSATNPLFTSITDGTSALGTMVNYGSTPTGVKALSTNTFVTNTVTVTQLATGDPCANPQVAKSSAVVNISGVAGTTQLVGVSGVKATYVCNFQATVVGTTPTILFEYGTSTTCVGTTALTGTLAVVTTSTVNMGYGGTMFMAPASNGLCLVAGGTTPSIQGFLTYVQQ